MALIKDYIEYLKKLHTDGIFNEAFLNKLDVIAEAYGSVESTEVILETKLNTTDNTCDYSIKVEQDEPHVKEVWYELDYDAVTDTQIIPCTFIDASFLKPEMDQKEAEAFIDTEVSAFAGNEITMLLKQQLLRVLSALHGKCKNIYQIGKMTSRNNGDSLRVFTSDILSKDVADVLRKLNWSGDIDGLSKFLSKLDAFNGAAGMIFDFDVFEDYISPKIGINFDILSFSRVKIAAFLDFLEGQNLCSCEKKNAVVDWAFTPPQGKPFIINDISHFKFAYDNGVVNSKVYLRQNSTQVRNFDMYFRPVLVNLELTDRCPLHCPQCYCDLNHGKDMDVETALYWIRQAGKEHVTTINLSGGESILYEQLTTLIRECRKYDIEPNVAFSGWGLTREKIESFIEAGIEGIFISLNGSTNEINSYSRDGYEYAVEALRILKEIGFKRTCVNWVMHRTNADDFENLIRLCESLSVPEIAVMVFKPNAAHELPSEPSAEQIRNIAKIIKNYKGPVNIEVESCFSQMRALLGEKFFINTNRGVDRGCGAGRDGISVSTDGRLSPCRHIESYENYSTIGDYWENSAELKNLRSMEEHMDSNCAACRYKKYCLPCAAVNIKLKGYIGMGHESCRLCEK